MIQMRAGTRGPQMRIYESFIKSLCLRSAAWRNSCDPIGLAAQRLATDVMEVRSRIFRAAQERPVAGILRSWRDFVSPLPCAAGEPARGLREPDAISAFRH